jgi:hypothetical protein
MHDETPSGISLREQIACVQREIDRRERMPSEAALLNDTAKELKCLQQVVRTLQALIDDGR